MKSRGRPPKPIADKPLIYGKARVMLDPKREMIIPVDANTRVLAQRLMLRAWPGVETVEQLIGEAARQALQALEGRGGTAERTSARDEWAGELK